jgi:lipooligosaccharide transport system permease protein
MESFQGQQPDESRTPRLAFARVHGRDALAVWRRHLGVYLRLWKMELAAPLIEPVFSIFAFGWGVGALIASEVSGMSYLSFIGAGVLAFAVLGRALFETTYGSYFRMVYQATFDAILSTPVEPESRGGGGGVGGGEDAGRAPEQSLAFAEICWATTKALIDSVLILLVLFVFGATSSPLALLVSLPLAAGSFFLASLSLGVTAHTRDIDSYNLYITLFFAAVFLCGVWFPVEVLPPALRALAWAIPLTSAVDLTRALLSGRLHPRHLYEALYLVSVSLLAAEWAMRSLRRRMVV